MFGTIGPLEMVIIAGVALVVIGPEKFPDFAKIVLRTVRDIRGYVDVLKVEATKELKPLKDEMNTLSRIDPEKYIDSLTGDEEDDKKNESSQAGSEGFTDQYTQAMEGGGEQVEQEEDPYGAYDVDDKGDPFGTGEDGDSEAAGVEGAGGAGEDPSGASRDEEDFGYREMQPGEEHAQEEVAAAETQEEVVATESEEDAMPEKENWDEDTPERLDG
jgi:Sec-independent protein translocase protein TatA